MLKAVSHAGTGWTEVDDLSRISELSREEGNLVWAQADVTQLAPDDLRTIQQEFGLDPLALEDAVHLRQRPKMEAYANHLFTVMHQLDEVDGQLEARQIACFIGSGWVLMLHEASQRTLDEAMSRCMRSVRGPGQGPSFVMHALLDSIVDEYQLFADRLEDEIEELEETALHRRTPVQNELYSVKQRVARLRRYVTPGERVLATVVEVRGNPLITERTAKHFRDVHDHALRIIDQIRNVDDLANAVVDLQRAEQAHALNEVTKRLTGWAAIIAVPTLIASVYGMNFRLFPEDGKAFGFWFALGMMVTTGVSLYVFFRKRGWI